MRMRALAVGLVAALAVVGCGGGGGAPVEGNVVIGGKAYNPETDGDLTISLTADGKSGTGQVQPDGTFTVMSATGKTGLPAGGYKVSYTRYPSKAEIAKLKGPPTPQNKDTGETWDVGGGKKFTLDLSKHK